MKKPLSVSLFFILYLSILVLVAVLLILGGVSPATNKKNPLAIIKTSWQHPVDPQVTEQQITNVLEKKLSEISEQFNIQSSSDENQSVIKIFSLEPNEPDPLRIKIKAALDNCIADLPQGIVSPPQLLQPIHQKNILLFTLQTNKLTPEALRKMGVEVIAPCIDAFPEVQQTIVLGGQENVLRICPDPFRMRAAGIDQLNLQEKMAGSLSGMGAPTVFKNDRSFFEDLENLVVVNTEGKNYLLKDLCTVTMQGEWLPGFSGRQEHPAVTVMVYCKENVSLQMMQEKILRKLKESSLVTRDLVNITPFMTEDKPVYTYIAPGRAALVCAIGFFFLLLMAMLADLSNAKKTIALSVAGIILILAPVVLYALKEESVEGTFHFSVAVPDQLTREQKEALVLRLATKLGKEVEDLIWFGNLETNEDPSAENQIIFYARLTKESGRDPFMEKLRKTLKEERYVQLTRFPPDENGFPVLYQVMLEGVELDQLKIILEQATRQIEMLQGVSEVWTVGPAFKPAVEWKVDHNKMAQLGISFFQVNRLVSAQELPAIQGIKVMVGCENKEYDELRNLAVTNVNGQQIPLSDFANAVKVARPKAIYHENRQRSMRLYFMADDEGAAERVKQVLSLIKLPQGYEFFMAEAE